MAQGGAPTWPSPSHRGAVAGFEGNVFQLEDHPISLVVEK